MEEEERAEEAAGARITKKKKKTKSKQGGRQAKLTSGVTDSGNSLKETRPSAFAEAVDPVIPEFTTERKTAGKGRGRVKSEPKSSSATGEGSGGGKDDSKQKKLKFESSDKKTKEEGGSGGGKAKKGPAEKPSKKRKVKELLDSFVISSDSEDEEKDEEEGGREIEKKSLHERIELRKTKGTDYKQDILSGEESLESEASWKTESDDGDAPPIKKAKLGPGGSKTVVPTATGESEKIDDDVSGETTKTAEGAKSKKAAVKPGGGVKVTARSKKESAAASKPAAAKVTTKPTAVKPSKGKATSSSSGSGSSGEMKKRGKVTLGKKRVMSHDFMSDDDEKSDYNIESGSGSDSPTIPAKKVATEVSLGGT